MRPPGAEFRAALPADPYSEMAPRPSCHRSGVGVGRCAHTRAHACCVCVLESPHCYSQAHPQSEAPTARAVLSAPVPRAGLCRGLCWARRQVPGQPGQPGDNSTLSPWRQAPATQAACGGGGVCHRPLETGNIRSRERTHTAQQPHHSPAAGGPRAGSQAPGNRAASEGHLDIRAFALLTFEREWLFPSK